MFLRTAPKRSPGRPSAWKDDPRISALGEILFQEKGDTRLEVTFSCTLPVWPQASTGFTLPEQIKRDVFEAVVSRLDTLPRSDRKDVYRRGKTKASP